MHCADSGHDGQREQVRMTLALTLAASVQCPLTEPDLVVGVEMFVHTKLQCARRRVRMLLYRGVSKFWTHCNKYYVFCDLSVCEKA